MKMMEERILKDGHIGAGNVLKVDRFLNHQVDVPFLYEATKEFYEKFKDAGVNKILTIEASGIGVAALTAMHFGCPLVFAKKTVTNNIFGDVYRSQVYSYTHERTYEIIVSKEFLSKDDRILVVDDFLAKGSALRALLELIGASGATCVGAGIAIEKAFQPGGKELREAGLQIESLARIKSMTEEEGIAFC